MQPMFSWEYRPTREEVLLTVQRAEPQKGQLWRPIVLTALAGFFVADFFVSGRTNGGSLALAGVSLVVAALSVWLPRYLNKKTADEQTAEGRPPQKVYYYEDGWAFDHPDDKRPLSAVRVVPYDDMFILFLSAHSYVCLPRRVVTDEQAAVLSAPPRAESDETESESR